MKFYFHPIIVATFADKFNILNATIIMGQK